MGTEGAIDAFGDLIEKADGTMGADHNEVNVGKSLLEENYIQALAHAGLQYTGDFVKGVTTLEVNDCFAMLKVGQLLLSGNVEDGLTELESFGIKKFKDITDFTMDDSDAANAQKNWENSNYTGLAYNVCAIALDTLCNKVGIDGDDVIQLAKDTYNGKSLKEIAAAGGEMLVDGVCKKYDIGEGDDVKKLAASILSKFKSVTGWSIDSAPQETIAEIDTAIEKLEKTVNARVVRAKIGGKWHRAVPLVQDAKHAYKVSYVSTSAYEADKRWTDVLHKQTVGKKLPILQKLLADGKSPMQKVVEAAKSLKQVVVPDYRIQVWDSEARKYIRANSKGGRSLMKHLVPTFLDSNGMLRSTKHDQQFNQQLPALLQHHGNQAISASYSSDFGNEMNFL